LTLSIKTLELAHSGFTSTSKRCLELLRSEPSAEESEGANRKLAPRLILELRKGKLLVTSLEARTRFY